MRESAPVSVPRKAIQIGGFSDAEMKTRIETAGAEKTKAPTIVAFCCQNSALEAGQMAQQFKMKLPEGLKMVQVPCAGKVDLDYILTAFIEGARRRFGAGLPYGQLQVRTRQHLCRMACPGCTTHAGRNRHGTRTSFALSTLAANMGSDFARIVNEMEADLKAKQKIVINPSPKA